jgi:TIGR03009 family protein
MLNAWMKKVLIFACAVIICPVNGHAQTQGAANQASSQQQNRQSNTPRLSPEQLAAQQRAAQESRAEQLRAQQAYANQTGPQQPGTPRLNPAQIVNPRRIIQPQGFPLEAAHTKYVNDLLDWWEKNSKQVAKYKCDFRRYEYDTDNVNWRDPQTNRLAAHKIIQGEIRFAAPDRARYETTKAMRFFKPPQRQGEQAEYQDIDDETAQERWICDGKSLFDFEFSQKRLYETKIPIEMQGNVAESPLPFIFGAEKKAILDRYWVRSVTPKGVENEYWLELFPKKAKDAQNYSKIEVIIAKEDFLPKAMHMYLAGYDPKKGNEKSRYFLFENREVNSQLAKFQDFFGAFVRPRVPFGWERVDTQVALQQRQAASPVGQQPAINRK